ncbi:MAG: hypothetical protein GDA43_10980 [Hormoscilla sp. SP5CHS1]|nr:hypothetical protein [Hormoscilla sp. SP12CHS1]MBC6453667.1 hypothetical protein [Hormoscilla sp. SP5CHS1]MBC6475237.1 hypothetical protein [Hormoscilla sp. GM102CHS1]
MKKIIRTQAQAVLAIAFVAVWCPPVAQAQSGRPSREADVTLSGESLRTIESRTTSSDYQRSFERASQPGVEASTDLSRSREENKLRIDERTEVVVDDLRDSGDSLNLFRVPGDVRDSKRVLLKIELGD